MKAIFLSTLFFAIAVAIFGLEEPRSGIFIVPLITSGHFGIVGDNFPSEFATTPAGSNSYLSPIPAEATRRLSFGAKLGIFYRPESCEGKNRFDLEAQWDNFSNKFRYMNYTADTLGNASYSAGNLDMSGNGATVKIRWGYNIDDKCEPFVSLGYTVDLLQLGDASGVGHGPNLGAGMRILICSRFSFIFEYETCPMSDVEFDLNKVDEDLSSALGATAKINLEPGYSQVMVGFEFPISLCINCSEGGAPCPDDDCR